MVRAAVLGSIESRRYSLGPGLVHSDRLPVMNAISVPRNERPPVGVIAQRLSLGSIGRQGRLFHVLLLTATKSGDYAVRDQHRSWRAASERLRTGRARGSAEYHS